MILDLMLPDRAGLDVCRTLRSDPRTEHVPIVICSGLGRTRDRVAGLEAGADDYLVKPVALRELGLRLSACIRRARAR